MDKGLLAILIGVALLLVGCTNFLQDSKTAWNVVNVGAYEALEEVERLHTADTTKIVEDADLSKEQKLEQLKIVEARWHKAYVAYRTLRASLASAKAAIAAAEAAEASGATPDWIKLQEAVRAAVVAQQALAEAMP